MQRSLAASPKLQHAALSHLSLLAERKATEQACELEEKPKKRSRILTELVRAITGAEWLGLWHCFASWLPSYAGTLCHTSLCGTEHLSAVDQKASCTSAIWHDCLQTWKMLAAMSVHQMSTQQLWLR